MNKQIDDIRKKYGEPMLRMAIDHIIGVGTNNLKNVNADEVCARILKENAREFHYDAGVQRRAYALCNRTVADSNR